MLDRQVCERARVARDGRFDGAFFTGVRTTGIYCRPICPVRPARAENVFFFPSAAAAEQAGFRPCRRCRPEAAPTVGLHADALIVVRDGLRLIDGGFLDGRSVADLAATLGVSERHLTRLFAQHVGATPGAAARTRRVQAAKRLLDESSLRVTDIAFAAGFSSLRRFNAAFADVYGCPPSQIRRAAPPTNDRAGLVVRLRYRPPLDWATLTRCLASEATPSVECVDANGYRRTIEVDGQAGWLEVMPDIGHDRLMLAVRLPEAGRLHGIVERVRVMFDLGANPGRIAGQLAALMPEADGCRASIEAVANGLRLPGAWDGFEAAVRGLIALDVGPVAASSIMGRLVAELGTRLMGAHPGDPDRLFPTAATIAQADLSGYGIAEQTATRVRRLAEAIQDGAIRFWPATFGDLTRALVEIAELDPATAHWVALRTVGEPDAQPFGTQAVAGLDRGDVASLAEQESWRPWRSYVAVAQAAAHAQQASSEGVG